MNHKAKTKTEFPQTTGTTLNNRSTTTTPPWNRQQPKPPGGLNAFNWYQIFAIDSVVVRQSLKIIFNLANNEVPVPEVIKLFFLLNSTVHEISTAHEN